jgi:hypothetical protein
MDLQLEGLRYKFDEVNAVLRFVEPQLKLKSINMYVAAHDTELRSIADIKGPIDSGKHESAFIPVTEIRAPATALTASP